MSRAAVAIAALASLSVAACSSIGSSAVRTGGAREPPYAGPVAVFAAGLQPIGQDLGVVEVHGSNQDGTIEALLPVFVRRVAQLGGDAAIVDDVRAQFHVLTTAMVESYTYPCGYRALCTGTRVYPVNDEVMTVVMRGRAMKMRAPLPPSSPPAPITPPDEAPR